MATQPGSGAPIKVGVIADQTGPLSFVGLANANVARMVIGDINAKGGLLGRQLELHLEDGATDDAVAAARAAKLVEHDQVDVIFGGIYSSTRQAIKGPAVVEGKTLYIYPEQYEGQESDPLDLLHRPGAGAAGRPVHPVADARDRGEDVLPALGRLHLAARDERARPGGRHGQRRRDRRRGVLPARPHGLPRDRRADHRERRRRRVQHDRAARGHAVLRGAARLRLHAPRRTARLHVLRRELPEHGAGRPRRGAVRLPRLLPGRRAIRSAGSCSSSTTRSIPATRSSPVAARARASTAGCGSGPPR